MGEQLVKITESPTQAAIRWSRRAFASEAELTRVQEALDSEGGDPGVPHESVWVWIGRANRAEDRLEELGELKKLEAEGWCNE